MNRSIIKLLLLCDALNKKNQKHHLKAVRIAESNMSLYIRQIPIKKN